MYCVFKPILENCEKLISDNNEEDREKFPYKCDVCGLTYTDSTKLKCHMGKHTGNAKLKCDICNLTFPDSHGMNKHMKTKRHIQLEKFAETKNTEESNEMVGRKMIKFIRIIHFFKEQQNSNDQSNKEDNKSKD